MGLWLIVGVASKARQPILKETSMISTNTDVPLTQNLVQRDRSCHKHTKRFIYSLKNEVSIRIRQPYQAGQIVSEKQRRSQAEFLL